MRISPVYHIPTLTCQLLAMGRFLQSGYTSTGNKDTIVRNVTKNSLFSPNFFLTLITYELLSYSVRLHCANLHTPLPFLLYLYDFQNMKTRHPDLLSVILNEEHP